MTDSKPDTRMVRPSSLATRAFFAIALLGFLALQSFLDARLGSYQQLPEWQNPVFPAVVAAASTTTTNTSVVQEEAAEDDAWIAINGWRFQPNRLSFPPTIRNCPNDSNASNVTNTGSSLDVSPVQGRRPEDQTQYQHDWKPKNFTEKKLQRHPFLGAKDEFGNFGYVANAKAHLLPQNQRPLTLLPAGFVQKNDHHNNDTNSHETAARYVCRVPVTTDEWLDYYVAQRHLQVAAPPSSSRMVSRTLPHRILCAVYTHADATAQTEAIRQTWGGRCDGLLFLSTVTNHTTLHIQMPHASMFEGKYRGLWQRTRAILASLYMHYMEDYDYFHICGDDTYVIVENLRYYLTSSEIVNLTLSGQPFFGGFWTQWHKEHAADDNFYYLGGGAGYTLNVPALKTYLEEGPMDHCTRNFNDGPVEDVNVAWCFRDEAGVVGWDTRDASGAHRYHILSSYQHAILPARKWGTKTHIVKKCLTFMQSVHGFPIVYGPKYLSPYSVAFHDYKQPEQIQRMDYWLYGNAKVQEQCAQLVLPQEESEK